MERALSGPNAAFWPNGAVELVLDLQQAGRQLNEFPMLLEAQGLIGTVGAGQRSLECLRIGCKTVVGHLKGSLSIALVPEAAHAEGGGMGQEQRVLAALFQLMGPALEETFEQRRGSAKQVKQ